MPGDAGMPARAAALLGLLVAVVRVYGQDGRSSTTPPGTPPSGVFRVGAVLSGIGEAREAMLEADRGYRLFESVANGRAGGRGVDVRGRDGLLNFRFNFTAADDQDDPGRHGALVAGMLAPGGPHFLFGSRDRFAANESAMAGEAGRIIYHCCAAGDGIFAAGRGHAFGVAVSRRRYAELAVNRMNLNGLRRLAVVTAGGRQDLGEVCGAAVEAVVRYQERVKRDAMEVVVGPVDLGEGLEAGAGALDGFVADARGRGAEAVLACVSEGQGKILVAALERERYPLKALFLTSGPAVDDWVEDLSGQGSLQAENLLSAVQWHRSINRQDDFYVSAKAYSNAFRSEYGTWPTGYAAGASAVGYTLVRAIQNAFRKCDILKTGGDPDKLLFDSGVLECSDGGNKTGYVRVREALAGLDMNTFFGKVRFDTHGRNIGKQPVTTQVHTRTDGSLKVEAVLPVGVAAGNLVLPARNRHRRVCVGGEFLSKALEDWLEPCRPCERGKVSIGQDEPSCRSCAPGLYWENSTQCSDCPENTEIALDAETLGRRACMCKAGYFQDLQGEEEVCKACPIGATCDGGVNPPCPIEGYWMDSSTKSVHVCDPEFICKGACGDDQCIEGHTDRLCSKCDAGYFALMTRCYKCIPAPAVVAMILVLVVAWYVINIVVSTNVASLDIMLSWAQLANVIGEVDLNWPKRLTLVFGIASVLDFDVDILSPSCLMTWSFTHSFIAQLLLPLVMTSLRILGYLLSQVAFRIYDRANYLQRKRIMSFNWLIDIPESKKQLAAKWDLCIAAFLSSLDVTYITVTKYSFGAFKCRELGGQSVLQGSLDIVCGSREHIIIQCLGAFGTVVYSGGFLAFVCWKLWNLHGQQSLQDPVNLRRYGWLYRRFELEYFWTSVIAVSRKLLFMLVFVCMNNPAFQVFALAIIINASLMLHMITAPYVDAQFDLLFSFLLLSLMSVAFGGVMFYSDNLPPTNRSILEWLVLSALFVMVAVFSVIFFLEIRSMYHVHKLKKRHRHILLKNGRHSQKWSHVGQGSKKEHRCEISGELFDTFDASFLYKALLDDPENMVDFDKLTDMLKDFMSDQSETSYLSINNVADFWRKLVERFPELVDFLAVTDDASRSSFLKFSTALYNDFYLKKKVEELPLNSVLNWRDRAALAHWLAVADDGEREYFTSFMGKLFRSSHGENAALLLEMVKAGEGSDSTKTGPDRSKWTQKKRVSSKHYEGIMKEINEGKGPLVHSASGKRRDAPAIRPSSNPDAEAQSGSRGKLIDVVTYNPLFHIMPSRQGDENVQRADYAFGDRPSYTIAEDGEDDVEMSLGSEQSFKSLAELAEFSPRDGRLWPRA